MKNICQQINKNIVIVKKFFSPQMCASWCGQLNKVANKFARRKGLTSDEKLLCRNACFPDAGGKIFACPYVSASDLGLHASFSASNVS